MDNTGDQLEMAFASERCFDTSAEINYGIDS